MKKFQEWTKEREVNEQGGPMAAGMPPAVAPPMGVMAPAAPAGVPEAPVRRPFMGKAQIAKERREDALGQSSVVTTSVVALQKALTVIAKDKKAQSQLMPIVNKIIGALRIVGGEGKADATQILSDIGGAGRSTGRLKQHSDKRAAAAMGTLTAPAPLAGAPAPMGAPAGVIPGQMAMAAHHKPEGLVVTEGLINYIQKYNLG